MTRLSNLDQVKRDVGRRFPSRARLALRRAIDQSATYFGKELVDRVAQRTTVQKKSVRSKVRTVQRTSQSRLKAKVQLTLTPIPLAEFKPKTQTGNSLVFADINTRSGVGVEQAKRAFSIKGRRGKDSLRERIGHGANRVKRYPLRRKTPGAGLALMYRPLERRLRDDTQREMERRRDVEIDKEIRRL